MGYYTRYELQIESEDPSAEGMIWDHIIDEQGEGFGGRYYGVSRNGDADTCKWYEHEDEMKDLSKKFPSALFILSGEGEESGDIWRKYFKGGKMQTCRAVLTFEPYDETKLEE